MHPIVTPDVCQVLPSQGFLRPFQGTNLTLTQPSLYTPNPSLLRLADIVASAEALVLVVPRITGVRRQRSRSLTVTRKDELTAGQYT